MKTEIETPIYEISGPLFLGWQNILRQQSSRYSNPIPLPNTTFILLIKPSDNHMQSLFSWDRVRAGEEGLTMGVKNDLPLATLSTFHNTDRKEQAQMRQLCLLDHWQSSILFYSILLILHGYKVYRDKLHDYHCSNININIYHILFSS